MRLRRSDPDGPGARRVRHGRGFRYVDHTGAPVTDPEYLDRIRALVIPPAWREVWICPHPNGHLQAVGLDDAGRKQYLYHEQWRRDRDDEKHERVLRLAARLPRIRKQVHADLVTSGLGRDRVLAGALRILDRGVFRTGGEEYAEENDSHGVATLLREHVEVRRGEVRFCFPAKSGVERVAVIRDPDLGKLVTALRRGRADDDRLFAYRNGGERHEVRAAEVNDRFRELAGDGFTVKDMRTWTATVLAAAEFAAQDPPKSKTATKRTEAQVMRAVSEQLGNTPAVARRSYVDPRVPELFQEGRTIEATLRKLASQDLENPEVRERLEHAVLRLLRSA
ncbi:DNA topoisomerase IB [Actinokineospora alba]|uniref:DNA topoisomerase n=1 Tax=Actinokineospora alba TaxID=504798 RepID=A0A1H0ND03_9PSEU|nr:DNA topoisomerase IB [Actinokineospora alba]TDP68667.1 DNA topoisomerase IB [Actinokineospora alba]SDH84042.1 DNA topoisomerase IB [Actinokineospora alba]SDO90275.1 DNA topoisomerase IB [Actinokineospora alba]